MGSGAWVRGRGGSEEEKKKIAQSVEDREEKQMCLRGDFSNREAKQLKEKKRCLLSVLLDFGHEW